MRYPQQPLGASPPNMPNPFAGGGTPNMPNPFSGGGHQNWPAWAQQRYNQYTGGGGGGQPWPNMPNPYSGIPGGGGAGTQNPNYFTPQMPEGMHIQPGMLGAGNPMAGGGNPAAAATMGATGGLGSSFPGSSMGSNAVSAGMGALGAGNPAGVGGAAGGMGDYLGPIFQHLFGGGQSPGGAGMKYLNQIPGMLKPYYDPYINAGRNALGVLQGQYGGLINDPGAMMNKFGAGFQESPGYQYQKQQMEQAGNAASAAGGFIGSPQAQAAMQQNIGGLANQEYNNYMNRVLGMYGMGLQGEQGINQMGFQGATGLADQLAQNAQNQAMMKYMQQKYQNEQQGGFWNAIGGAVGHLIPHF